VTYRFVRTGLGKAANSTVDTSWRAWAMQQAEATGDRGLGAIAVEFFPFAQDRRHIWRANSYGLLVDMVIDGLIAAQFIPSPDPLYLQSVTMNCGQVREANSLEVVVTPLISLR
jgi:hypothetical protein